MTRLHLAAAAALTALIAACSAPRADTPAQSGAPSTSPTDVQVMVLGAMHFNGSDSDLVSIKPDNVLAPKRQAELAQITDALAAFNPTHIVVERETDAPGYTDPNYAAFTDETLATVTNERVQLGYRLARQLGLETVHGIDEQPSEGEPDYFPFDTLLAHAEKTGQSETLGNMLADFEAVAVRTQNAQKDKHLAAQLLAYNQGTLADMNAEFYYQLSKFDTGEDQPGAELQAYWFMRNTKIFSKVEDVTAPGDRVLIIYGAGHKYWLEHLANHTPGFASVDPVPYLATAAP